MRRHRYGHAQRPAYECSWSAPRGSLSNRRGVPTRRDCSTHRPAGRTRDRRHRPRTERLGRQSPRAGLRHRHLPPAPRGSPNHCGKGQKTGGCPISAQGFRQAWEAKLYNRGRLTPHGVDQRSPTSRLDMGLVVVGFAGGVVATMIDRNGPSLASIDARGPGRRTH